MVQHSVPNVANGSYLLYANSDSYNRLMRNSHDSQAKGTYFQDKFCCQSKY